MPLLFIIQADFCSSGIEFNPMQYQYLLTESGRMNWQGAREEMQLVLDATATTEFIYWLKRISSDSSSALVDASSRQVDGLVFWANWSLVRTIAGGLGGCLSIVWTTIAVPLTRLSAPSFSFDLLQISTPPAAGHISPLK